MWFLPIHDYGRTRTEACSSDHHSLRITLQFTMFYFFKDFGLFAICSVLFSASSPFTILPPIVPRSQVLMHSSFQETRNSVASRYELLNSAVIARSVFLLLRKPRLCLCFHLLCHLCICHLFSVHHPHIVIRPSRQLIQLPQCIQVPRPLRQVPRLLLHRTQQFICSPGLLSRHNPHRKDLFLEFL